MACEGDRKPFVVSVEGNVGSGKSTMIKFFERFPDVELCPEPVDRWCDLKGHNLLEQLYEDPRRWSFQFQSYVQLTRLEILQKPSAAKVRIIERSIQNNRFCFLELARRLGSLSEQELTVLESWHDWFASSLDLDLDLIVYLRTSPEVAHERMRARNRKEESGVVPLDYLRHLHVAYEDWLIHQKFEKLSVPILVVDADQSLADVQRHYEILKDHIMGGTRVKGVFHFDDTRKGAISCVPKPSVVKTYKEKEDTSADMPDKELIHMKILSSAGRASNE